MTILGIDPGLATTGYGIVEIVGRRIAHREHGIVRTSARSPYHERLMVLSKEIKRIIRRRSPQSIGIEKLYIHKNLKTAMMVGEARGVLIFTVATLRIPFYEFTPLQVKQALTGYGRATKLQVQKMVQRILQMRQLPEPDDAGDALAVAICLAHTRQ